LFRSITRLFVHPLEIKQEGMNEIKEERKKYGNGPDLTTAYDRIYNV